MIVVYGKYGCGYCEKAKNLLDMKKIPYEYFTIGEDIGVNEFVEQFPDVRSAPFIINNNEVIGGYTDLQKYIEETSSGFTDSF